MLAKIGDTLRPHCDGACDGSEHITAGRVATAVSYCQVYMLLLPRHVHMYIMMFALCVKVPRRGGATTFSKAGVHVKPKAGAAVFFTYLGDDGMMDRGITEHSGCPVLEGEKWLATMWFRKGVTTERHSGLFDAIGIKKADGIVV